MDAERMTTVFRATKVVNVTGEVVAKNVDYEDFLRGYDGQHVEWINGVVIRMSPVSADHNAITRFLIVLFDNLLGIVGGQVFHDPMTMRLGPDQPARQPDIQVLLSENAHRIQKSSIEGPADLVVEVVSRESAHRDYFEKFQEYELAGVQEYWIIDPLKREAHFYTLDTDGTYHKLIPDHVGVFKSDVLPALRLPVDIFWRDELPRGLEIARLVEAMLGES